MKSRPFNRRRLIPTRRKAAAAAPEQVKLTPSRIEEATALIPLALLDTENDALVVISPRAAILFANRSGATLLKTGALLKEADRVVTAGDSWRGDFEAAREQVHWGRSARLYVQAAGRHLTITLSPLETDAGRLCVLRICDKAAKLAAVVERFAATHGLSPRETELLHNLSEGKSLADFARAGGRTMATVRTQLRCITKKVKISRQHELLARMHDAYPI